MIAASPPAASRVLPALRIPGPDRRWFVATLLVAGLLTLVAGHWTQRMWAFTPDEVLFRSLAGWVPTDLPWSLVDLSTYERGLQRFGIWIQALGLGLFGSGSGFQVARWAFSLAFASTVAPVWLLARGAGAEPAWASVGALLAVVVPWALLTGTFLTEPIAYPLFAWAMLAFWACAVRGGRRADLLALLAILAAALARTSMLMLVGVLVLVVVGQELRLAPRSGGLRRLPARFVARHPVLLVAGALVALLALGGAMRRAIGVYQGVGPHADRFAEGLRFVLSVAAPGLGYVALVGALAFAVTHVVRAGDERRLALSLLVFGALLMMLLTAMTGNVEERYVFYWVAPCAAAFACAGARRDVAWWALAAAAALVLWACVTRVWATTDPTFTDVFFLPAEVWNTRVVRLGIAARLHGVLGLDPEAVQILAILGAALVAAALTMRLPERLAARPAVRAVGLAAGAALLVAGAVQVRWVFHAFLERGGGWRPLAQQTWIDPRAAGRDVGLWLPSAPAGLDPAPWRTPRYYNLAVRQLVRLGAGQEAPAFADDRRPVRAQLDPATGRVSVRSGRMPPLVVAVPERDSAPLRGQVIGRGPDWDVRLVHPAQPLAVRRAIVAGPADGRLRAGERLVIRSYAPYGAQPACLELVLQANDRPAAAAARGAGVVRRAALAPAGTATLAVPLLAARSSDVTVRASGAAGPDWLVGVTARGPVACTRPPG